MHEPSAKSPSPAAAPAADQVTTLDDGGPAGIPDAALCTEQPGRYQLVGVLGRGGQAVVHLARDVQLGRQIAFKQLVDASERDPSLPSGTGSEVRFVREARIVAQLDHPGIAPVHEVGRRADGSLYATQKLVRGRTLAAALAACGDLEQRLGLLQPLLAVCQAVAYAHARGVIHRDLKPSNVMLGELGEAAVLDWGLACVLAAPGATAPSAPELPPLDLELDGGRTQDGAVLGTPFYMSPEQAAGAVSRLDARSDVWSLGVILYELLTGSRPFSGANTRAVLWSLSQGRPRVVREACPRAPAELAAIAERALERDPARRYADAGELAAELGRFLTGRLVLAHSYTTRERVLHFARRHAALLGTAAAFTVALWITAGIGVQRVLAERDRANREAKTAQAVSDFLATMFKVNQPSEARGRTVTAREILDKATGEIGKGLAGEPEVEARLTSTMAGTYRSLGLFADAQKLALRAVALREKLGGPDHVETLHARYFAGLCLFDLGRFAEAEVELSALLERQRALLGPGHLDTLNTQRWLATCFTEEGKLKEAEAAGQAALAGLRQRLGDQDLLTLATLSSLGANLRRQGKLPEAERAQREVLETARRALGPEHRETMRAMNNLSGTLLQEGRYADAEALQRETLALKRKMLGPEHASTLQTTLNLGGTLIAEGRYPEAEELLAGLLVLDRKVVGDDHPETLAAMVNLGAALRRQGKDAAAEPLLRDALERQKRRLGLGHEDAQEAALHLACVLSATGRAEEALALLTSAVEAGLPAALLREGEKDGDLKALRADPRFAALVARAK